MAKNATVPRPTHEEIAERARAIYEQSGRAPGRDVQNWLEAEAQLTAAHNNQTQSVPPMRALAKAVLGQPAT